MRTAPMTIVFVLAAASSGAEVTLVEKGQPRATIVIGAEASDQAREVAKELQTYVERISGATLPIASERDAVRGPRVLVGRSSAVARLGVDIPSGFTTQLNEEGFVIKTVDGDLVLAGNEERAYRGTAYAVYELLEQLGCRWYFPGEFGEVLPSMDTITVPEMDRVERPDFRIRRIGYAGWMPISAEDAKAFRPWYDRHKLNGLAISMPGDGSVKRLGESVTVESHPHLYSIDRRGNRWEGMFCTTNKEVRAMGAAVIKKYFREHPEVHSFGFAPSDGYSPRCHCEDCRRLVPGLGGKGIGEPSYSDVWFRFANSVATEVHKEFPERWVLTNGYANRVRLPESLPKLSPNLGIQLATIHICSLHRIGDPRCWARQVYERLVDRWTSAVKCVIVYDYDPGTAVDNLPFPALHNLKHDMPYFKRRGLWGFWTHAANSWMVTHLNYYVRAKLMWDTKADVDALVHEYCRLFYGPAATAVEEYLWTYERALEETHVHTAWGDVIPWTVILSPVSGDLDRLIREAESKAQNTSFALRVRILRITHDHMRAYVAMEKALAEAKFTEAVAWTNRMLELRDMMGAIRSGLLPHTAEFARDFRSTIEWHRTLYADLAAKAGGEQGELVATLPRTWQFKKDPKDMGTIYQWYLPGHRDGWEPIDTTLYWQAQGHIDATGWGYFGKAWYRCQFEVPADAAGKPLTLTLGGVYYQEDYDEGVWVWVNGRLMTPERCRLHPMGGLNALKPIHVDVTGDVRAGRTNAVAVLVHTDPPARFPRGGMHRRSFLWSPRPEAGIGAGEKNR